MTTAVIILSALSGLLLGIILGALGVFVMIGSDKKEAPRMDSGLMDRLRGDMQEIPDDWEKEGAGEGEGEVEEYSLDPDQ